MRSRQQSYAAKAQYASLVLRSGNTLFDRFGPTA
jgi:hypothetical protein